MIAENINKLIGKALKEREPVKLSTYRLLSSALNYERIAKLHDLNDEEELVVVRREVKKRQDAIEAYKKANAFDRAKKEEEEMLILREFLPPQLAKDEVEKIVTQTIKEINPSGPQDMGKVIGAVMAKTKGQVDGSEVASLVKAKLIK